MKQQTYKRYFLLFSILVLSLSLYPKVSIAQTVTIESDTLNVRSGPGLSYPIIGTLEKGTTLSIQSKADDWYEISYKNETGWIAAWLTTMGDDSQQEVANRHIVSQTNQLNIRAYPSLNAAVVGQLQAGDEAIVTGESGEWTAISFNGMEGWVHQDYIAEISPDTVETTAQTQEETTKPRQFTVAVDGLIVRKKADQSSKQITIIKRGEAYEIVKKEGNWVQLQLTHDQRGWVYLFHGVLSSQPNSSESGKEKEKQVTILTDGTNIRASATTNSTIVHRANAGEKFIVTGTEGDWFEIQLTTDERAYVANWVVTEDAEMTTVSDTKKPLKKGTLKGLTIVLDAGHGGHDRGTTGARGTNEKDLTLMTSEILASKLQAAGAHVILTRDSDTFISLNNRVGLSHQYKADAFVSLHYDANLDRSITGFTTYYTQPHQRSLAEAINDSLAERLTIRNRGAQQNDYLVLRENQQPAVLIELGFLSNPAEERVVTTERFREQATMGIYEGLLNYFEAFQAE